LLTLIPIGLSMAKDDLSGKLAVILHADVAGSTQLVQQDELIAHERIQDAFRRFSNSIEKYMEGSVRPVGNQVRINAQLIDATTGGPFSTLI